MFLMEWNQMNTEPGMQAEITFEHVAAKGTLTDTTVLAVAYNGCAGSMGAWGGVTGRGYALATARFLCSHVRAGSPCFLSDLG